MQRLFKELKVKNNFFFIKTVRLEWDGKKITDIIDFFKSMS